MGNNKDISNRQKAKKNLYDAAYWLRKEYDVAIISKHELFDLSRDLQGKELNLNNIYICKREKLPQMTKYKE